MAKEVIVTADKLKDRKKLSRLVKISLLILLLMLIVIYIILQVVYSEGRFTVTLDPNSQKKSGLTMYESLNDPTNKRQLTANSIQFMDNISIKWIPQNINNEAEGSHNGQNYIAYTFYLENHKRLNKNIFIVSNEFIWNKNGVMIGYKEPIIHSCDKDYSSVKKFPFYKYHNSNIIKIYKNKSKTPLITKIIPTPDINTNNIKDIIY
jgi:hypothetical protein